MEASPLTQLCLKELASALKEFGRHTFFDKGPQEVVDLDLLTGAFREVGVEASYTAICEILDTGTPEAVRLVSAILVDLQDWDALWDAHGAFLGDYL